VLAAIPLTVWVGTIAARSIRRLRNDVTRFVPQEFMELLGREDLQGLQLGDHIEREMTVLFSDIRSFTTLSGKMTPQQTFNFVNSYLTRIGPIVREHRGFIDKYIGDAIMALFPERPANAIETAIAMQRRVVIYNQERARAGYDPVAIGIGVHCGKLMLGTIGEAQRFETTVISDVVNIASRLESLTKTFQVLILASGDVVDELEKGSCCARRLCDVQVQGATHPITLYEICDADPPDLMEHKVATMDEFAIGRVAYAQGHFADAFRAFEEIAEREPRDLCAAYFRDRAWELSRMPGLTWDGIERMESK
jgi:two-component system sensor histidine kinase ChiS